MAARVSPPKHLAALCRTLEARGHILCPPKPVGYSLIATSDSCIPTFSPIIDPCTRASPKQGNDCAPCMLLPTLVATYSLYPPPLVPPTASHNSTSISAQKNHPPTSIHRTLVLTEHLSSTLAKDKASDMHPFFIPLASFCGHAGSSGESIGLLRLPDSTDGDLLPIVRTSGCVCASLVICCCCCFFCCCCC